MLDQRNLVEPPGVAGAADRIERLLVDDRRRVRFGRHGREHVRDLLLLPRQLADLFGVLVELITNTP